ncbi:ABC transporter permease [Salinibacterium sp. TMP30]|uniref:ABC transporter permease n=1 Tax=Salinibacterium sp. TMP30 TaxID=3138237 RepID=UPI00313A4D8C
MRTSKLLAFSLPARIPCPDLPRGHLINTTTARRHSPSFAQSVSLVAEREITARLRSKSFLITTGILLLLVLGGVIAGGIMSNTSSTTPVAVVSSVSSELSNATGLSVTGQAELLSLLGAPLLWFVGFYIIGFILLAALFAAVGAMVSRQEDLGSAMTPVTMLIMLPYFAIIFLNDNPVALAVMSYIPFSAPVGMPMRLFLGTAAWWEPLISLVLLVVTAGLAVLLGARIYNNSRLKVGTRVSWAQAIKG